MSSPLPKFWEKWGRWFWVHRRTDCAVLLSSQQRSFLLNLSHLTINFLSQFHRANLFHWYNNLNSHWKLHSTRTGTCISRGSPSCSVDVTERAGSSLQSPLLSADLTTAQTPSEFLALTEDSVSEVDAFPRSGSVASHCDNLGHNDSTSQISPNPAAVTKTTRDLRGTVPVRLCLLGNTD